MKTYHVKTADGFEHRFTSRQMYEHTVADYTKHGQVVVSGNLIERHHKPSFFTKGTDLTQIGADVFAQRAHGGSLCGKCNDGWILNWEDRTARPCGCNAAVNTSFAEAKTSLIKQRLTY